MSRTELEIDIASILYEGRKYNSDPISLARIILDHLETMDLIVREE